MTVRPVVLADSGVRLEPLSVSHAQELLAAAAHDEIWTYLDEPTPRTNGAVLRLIEEALYEQRQDRRVPFAIIDARDGRAVGSVSYIDIRCHDRGVEIGWMWLTPSRWGQGLGFRAIHLLAGHAFAELGAIRVAFKTDQRNVKSQSLIESTGAVREGVWRNHRILSDGTRRHSVFYSITDDEWPLLKDRARATSGA